MLTASPRLVTVGGVRLALHVQDLGLACCGVEVAAALHERTAQPETAGADRDAATDAGPDAHVLLVSGTVTDVLAGALARIFDEVPEPRFVVSIGACCATGGPYWDSYSVTKGIDQVLPVHVSVPGCPPRPEAVLGGLREVGRLITGASAVAPS